MKKLILLTIILLLVGICSAEYLGDFSEDSTIHFQFSTRNKNGGAVAPSSIFDINDIRIYKNNSATQKTTTNGITMTSPFDSITGLHAVDIDTNNNTGDTGFWTTNADYIVVLNPIGKTVDGETIVEPLEIFSIQNRPAAIDANTAAAAVINSTYGLSAEKTTRDACDAAILAKTNLIPASPASDPCMLAYFAIEKTQRDVCETAILEAIFDINCTGGAMSVPGGQ